MSEQLKSFISEQVFRDLKSLEYISELQDLCESLESDLIYWKKWYSEEKVEEIELPKKFKDINDFHRLMIIRFIRPDRTLQALKYYVEKMLGAKYVQSKPFDIK